MKIVIRAALGLVLAGALAACGGSTATPTASTTKATLNASEFAFDPAILEVAAGAKLELTLVNKGTLEHDFTIDSLSFAVHAPVGTTEMLTTGALAAGTYEFYCSIPGHKQAGMTGTLTVK